MFGTNVIRKYEDNFEGQTVQVHEVFRTIQGEGPLSGVPSVFVRLTGCNFRCWFCDTHWDDEEDPYYAVGQLVQDIRDCGKTPLVVITGGEPCRQNLAPLVGNLRAYGYKIQVETAGSIWQDCLVDTTIVVSPKAGKVAKEFLEERDNVYLKYVLEARNIDEDGLPLKNPQRGKGPVARPPFYLGKDKIYVQPCDEQDESENKANLFAVRNSCLEHGYRASVQLHKLIDVE
jgi:7-carboxy-7-deazaguanine synthase